MSRITYLRRLVMQAAESLEPGRLNVDVARRHIASIMDVVYDEVELVGRRKRQKQRRVSKTHKERRQQQ